jgi:hypothetical protein
VKNETITVIPDKWLTANEAAAVLRKNVRTVQKMAIAGMLTTKPAENPQSPHARLYDPKDVERHIPASILNPGPKPRSHHKKQDLPGVVKAITARPRPRYKLTVTLRDERGSTRMTFHTNETALLENPMLAAIAQVHEHSMPAASVLEYRP